MQNPWKRLGNKRMAGVMERKREKEGSEGKGIRNGKLGNWLFVTLLDSEGSADV